MSTTHPALHNALTAAIQRAIASGYEEGIQLCAYQHGQRVVDLCMGDA